MQPLPYSLLPHLFLAKSLLAIKSIIIGRRKGRAFCKSYGMRTGILLIGDQSAQCSSVRFDPLRKQER